MGAAFGAKLACDRLLQILAGKLFRRALVYLKPSGGIATNMFGDPPVIYWHSRQWHCAFIIGSPSAS